MHMKDLKNRIARELVVGTDHRVIAAGPLFKQPLTLPYRIVILNWGAKFSVHTQYFNLKDLGNLGQFDLADECDSTGVETSFESGTYFEIDELQQAMIHFADAIKRHASFVPSLYRDIDAKIQEPNTKI
jgi:hypothetical protein